MTTASSSQDLTALINGLASALVGLERLDPSRLGPRQRIELLWASEQLRSFGATPRSDALPVGDSDPGCVQDAADANRDFAAALIRTDTDLSPTELAQLGRIASAVDAVLSACEGAR